MKKTARTLLQSSNAVSMQKTVRTVQILAPLVLFVCARSAFAQEVPLEVGIGSIGSIGEPYLENYISMVYAFIVGGIGIVAAVFIIFNGMRWVTAAGNAENVSVAKTGISNAIIGLCIALMSYVLLNVINPSLVSFPGLEMEDIEFVEPATRSTAAIAAADISLDESLVDFTSTVEGVPSELKAYYVNYASLPYIQPSALNALVNALELLRDETEYQGMRLVISGANRTLDQQAIFYACYIQKKDTGQCPATGCEATNCNVASPPEPNSHTYGIALDLSWENTGSGQYETTMGYASSSWHNSCMANQEGSACTEELRKSVIALNTLMQQAGWDRICIEWWHHQLGGSPQSYFCDPGDYIAY